MFSDPRHDPQPLAARVTDPFPGIDRHTLARLHQRDLAALDQVIRQFGGRIHTYLRRVLGRAADAEALAEDLCHDTLVCAFERARECRDPATFPAWLFRIARNRALDAMRTRVTRGRLLDRFRRHTRPPVAESPLDGLARRELQQRFEAAVRRLKEPFRSVFLLREVEGMSYEEIAEVMEISAKTVSSRLARAREALRGALADYLGEVDP